MTSEIPTGKQAEKELIDFLARLPRVALGEQYSTIDRARDFLAVFQGSDSGRRVLAQIMDFCNPPPLAHGQMANTTDLQLAHREGMRLVFAEISRAMVVRQTVPTKQEREKTDVDKAT